MAIIKLLISPINIVIIPFFMGTSLILIKKNEKFARLIICFALFCLCLFSFRPFSNFLLWRLERTYPPINHINDNRDFKYIVLLTAWDSNNPTVPYTSNIGYRSALRTLEAHRIFKQLPQSRIIISGGNNSSSLMYKFLVLLGVPAEKIIRDNNPPNTWSSAINLSRILDDQAFLLVTSAIHMPRSMKCFTGIGLHPIPAPADYLYGYYPTFHFSNNKFLINYLPNVNSFFNTSRAIYEYIANLWYAIKVSNIDETKF